MQSALGARIRSASAADAEALAFLHLDVWEDAYADLMPATVFAERRAGIDERIDRWRSQLTDGPLRTLVAENETGLIGFSGVGVPRDDDVDVPLELWGLYVRAGWWGTGIGHALLVAAVGEEPACLWVLDGNERAIGFYRRHGFGEDGATRTGRVGRELRMLR